MTRAPNSLFFRKAFSHSLVFLLSLCLSITLAPGVSAAPNTDLKSVRAQVEQLQEDTAEAGENAQAAKIQLSKLKKQLSAVQQQADEQKQTVDSIKKSLAAINQIVKNKNDYNDHSRLKFLFHCANGQLTMIRRKSISAQYAYREIK